MKANVWTGLVVTDVDVCCQVAPERVTISGHQNAKAGDTVKLRCESSISNPPAIISWFTRGRHQPGGTNTIEPSAEVVSVSFSCLIHVDN